MSFDIKKMRNSQKAVFLLFLVGSVLGITGVEECLKESPCRCSYSDGFGWDLSDLKAETYKITLSDQSIFYFHPCQNANISTNCTDTSLCLQSGNVTEPVGLASEVSFVTPENREQPLRLLYKYNDKTRSISLSCANSPKAHLVQDTLLDFTFYSIDSCVRELPGTSSTSLGTFLVTMLFFVSSAYFFGGAIALYTLRGARGREMIPHVDFWTGLPGLCYDGWIFARNGFKPTPSGPNAYDAI